MNSDTLIVKTARKTLEIEANCLLALHKSINEDFVACVKAIYSSPGRLVVTGIGKSAIIAQKIVATLNSTGTPAIFLHAAEAIHGDLGMVQPDDVVLCISNSGSSPEIKILLPILQKFGNQIIAMTGNTDSFLAKNSHQVTHFIGASAIGIYPDSYYTIYNETNLEVDNSFL